MHRQQSGTTPICFPPAIQYHWHGHAIVLPRRGEAQQEGDCAGCICAERSGFPSRFWWPPLARSPKRRKSPQATSPLASHCAAPPRHRYAGSHPVANDSGGRPDAYFAPAREFGAREIGKAAWYNFVGRYTSTGERLDTVSATAAHRTLPLSSYAKVTNLDSGRSVIVRINDRGPWTRRFIIDLSPRAADELDMKRAGVASVMVEPISAATVGAKPTLATFLSSDAPVTQ